MAQIPLWEKVSFSIRVNLSLGINKLNRSLYIWELEISKTIENICLKTISNICGNHGIIQSNNHKHIYHLKSSRKAHNNRKIPSNL